MKPKPICMIFEGSISVIFFSFHSFVMDDADRSGARKSIPGN
jgi:hypothetical protein